MRSIAVIGRKGGSGKTTLAVHLAIGLHLRGRRTVVADADPQGSSIKVLSGRREAGPEAVAISGPRLFALKTSLIGHGAEAFVIDTPAVLEEVVAQAVALSDLTLMAVRPTFLDLAAAVRSSEIVRRLRKPGLVVINQAPPKRDEVEPPVVKRAVEALGLLKLPIAPVILRSRLAYQWVLESGRSVEELVSEPTAAQEINALCAFIDRFAFGARREAGALGVEQGRHDRRAQA